MVGLDFRAVRGDVVFGLAVVVVVVVVVVATPIVQPTLFA